MVLFLSGFGVLAYIWITEEMIMSDKIYDILKWVALIFIPALGTLYFALSTIWGLPYGEQIVGTLTAVDTFLGALLGISTYQYNKEDS